MEAQQDNPTRLPADSITVTFTGDGGHTIENNGDEFRIDNCYFQTILNAYDERLSAANYMDQVYVEVKTGFFGSGPERKEHVRAESLPELLCDQSLRIQDRPGRIRLRSAFR
jgi:hypothetical protein